MYSKKLFNVEIIQIQEIWNYSKNNFFEIIQRNYSNSRNYSLNNVKHIIQCDHLQYIPHIIILFKSGENILGFK